jgi:hypothetical protein
MRRALAGTLATALLAPAAAHAFCGFYVGGADAKLYNNATMVVLMREGTRTVLSYGFVLTRLHARYGKDSLGEDLVFKGAPPIVGGREIVHAWGGKLEEGAKPASNNNFQGRYAIRHEWKGPIACEKPVRGRWGGPWPDVKGASSAPAAAKDLAFAPRGGVELAMLVKQDVPEIGLTMMPVRQASDEKKDPAAADAGKAKTEEPVAPAPKAKSCGCRVGGASRVPSAGLLLCGLALVCLRRRG